MTSLLVMAASMLYPFLPSWTQPIPPIFVLILLAGAVVSLLMAITAGSRGSRLWFLATPLPILFFLSVLLNFEQATEVKITGTNDNAAFVLSGSGKLTEFVVFSPEYPTAAESPKDMKFALWRIGTRRP
jgi:energy-coupling factor transporter transmembrane protein EcfT